MRFLAFSWWVDLLITTVAILVIMAVLRKVNTAYNIPVLKSIMKEDDL